MLDRAGELLDGATTLGAGLAQTAKDHFLDILGVAALLYYGLRITNDSIKLHRNLVKAKQLTPTDVANISAQASRAHELIELAKDRFHGGSYQEALAYINDALHHLQHPSSKKQPINIELLYLRACIHYANEQYVLAVQDLKSALSLNKDHTLSLNLLIDIHINHAQQVRTKVDVIELLKQSLTGNENQQYARFYKAILKNDLNSANAVMGEILKMLLSERNTAIAATIFHQTTPEIVVPYMIAQWMRLKIANENTMQGMRQIAMACTVMLEHNEAVTSKHLRIFLHECRISCLQQIARLNELNPLFDPEGSGLREANTLKFGDDYFFAYDGKYADQAFTRLFKDGMATDYLLDSTFKHKLDALIVAWLKAPGLLNNDNNPKLAALRELLQNNLDHALVVLDEATCQYFLDTHVKNAGWKPWLIILKNENGMPAHSLLFMACQQQGITLHVHLKDNQSLITGSENGIPLHVYYDQNKEAFTLLQPINTPADLYTWLALRECWQLLEDDSSNEFALRILGERGLAILPQLALAKFMDPETSDKSKLNILSGLRSFTANANNPDNSDKELAARLQEEQSRILRSRHGGLFSARNIALGCMAAGAAVGFYYSFSKE